MTKEEIEFWKEYSVMFSKKNLESKESKELSKEIKALIETKFDNSKIAIENKTKDAIKKEVDLVVKEISNQASKNVEKITEAMMNAFGDVLYQVDKYRKMSRILGIICGFWIAESIVQILITLGILHF